MENIADKSTFKGRILSEKEVHFLESFRTNYELIKTKNEFLSYSLKYYKIMKEGDIPNDVYVDSELLRQELRTLKRRNENIKTNNEKLVEINDGLEKRVTNYKNILSEVQSGLSSNLRTFFDVNKADRNIRNASLMSVHLTTCKMISNMTGEFTKSRVRKHLDLFEEELKLHTKRDPICSRFDEFNKSIKALLNGVAKKNMDSISGESSMANSSVGSVYDGDMSSKSNKSLSSSMTSVDMDKSDFFKKPILPVPKKKISTNSSINDISTSMSKISLQNISNSNLSVNECSDKSDTIVQISDPTSEISKITTGNSKVDNTDSSTSKCNSNSHSISDQKMNEITKKEKVPSEKTLIQNIGQQSTKMSNSSIKKKSGLLEETSKELIIDSRREMLVKVEDKLPSEKTFIQNIGQQSTKMSNISIEKKSGLSEETSKELKIDSRIEMLSKVEDKLPSEKTFIQNIGQQSTKMSNSSIEKKSGVSEETSKELKIDSRIEMLSKVEDKLPSEKTFIQNIGQQSTKVSNSSFEKKSGLSEETSKELTIASVMKILAKVEDKLPSEKTFIQNIGQQSTKVSNSSTEKKSADQAKSSEKSTDGVTKLTAKLEVPSENTFIRNIYQQSTKASNSSSEKKPVAQVNKSQGDGEIKLSAKKSSKEVSRKSQSTFKLNQTVISLSVIEETSETINSDSSGRTHSGKNSREKSTNSITLNIPNGTKNSPSNIPKLSQLPNPNTKSSNNREHENKENINESTLPSVYKLDQELQEFKKSFKFAFEKRHERLTSTQIDVVSMQRQSLVYDFQCNDPWNESQKKSIWTLVLPKFLNWKSVYTSDGSLSSNFNFGDQKFVIVERLKKSESVNIYIGCCHESSKKCIIKERNSQICFEFYIIKSILASLQTVYKSNTRMIDIVPSICVAGSLTLTPSSSYLLMPFYHKGDLVDLSRCLHSGNFIAKEIELLTAYIAMELIATIHQLHTRAKVLHCKIQPEKILLNENFPTFDSKEGFKFDRTGVLVLVGFSKAINLAKFPSNCGFLSNDKTMSNRCIEAKLKKQWSFQIDLFNVASSIFLLLQSSYPRVIQLKDRHAFSDFRNFSLLRAGDLWLNLFNFLLNFELKLYDEAYAFVEAFRQFICTNMEDFNRTAIKINGYFDKCV